MSEMPDKMTTVKLNIKSSQTGCHVNWSHPRRSESSSTLPL